MERATFTPADLRPDRVREHTHPEINVQIDDAITQSIHHYAQADKTTLSRRLEALDREWDIERRLETNAAAISLGGLALSLLVSRKWLAVPFVVAGFLMQHAVQGWCPPVPIMRRLGVRTRKEIERERQALKWLRGDYNHACGGQRPDVETILTMVQA